MYSIGKVKIEIKSKHMWFWQKLNHKPDMEKLSICSGFLEHDKNWCNKTNLAG